MQKISDSELKILTATLILKDKRIFITDLFSFFKNEAEQTILLILENLKKKKLIQINSGEIITDSLVSSKKSEFYYPSLLFGQTGNSEYNGKRIDNNVLRAVINLMISDFVPVREANIHSLNKNGKLNSMFPSLSHIPGNRYFFIIRKFLTDCGAVKVIRSIYIPVTEVCSSLFSLSPFKILYRIAENEWGVNAPYLLKDLIYLITENPTGMNGIIRMTDILKIKYDICVSSEEIISFLFDMNVLGSDKDEFVYVNNSLWNKEDKAQTVCDSDFHVTYTGQPENDDKLYLFADFEKCDKVNTYQVSRESYQRGITFGVKPEYIKEYLANPNLDSVLDSWFEYTERLRIYEGITLKCDNFTYNTVINIPDLKKEILHDLGNGTIILKSEGFNAWSKILSEALGRKKLPFYYCNNSCEQIINEHEQDSEKAEITDPEKPETCVSEICVSEPAGNKDLYSLGLSRSDMNDFFSNLPTESISGADYLGKTALIKQSLKDKTSLLEFEFPSSEKIVCHVRELIKTSDAGVLVKITVLPDREEKILSVSGIYRISKLLKLN